MNVLSLCSGIAGLDLGVMLAEPSSRIVGYVEGEAFAASVIVSQIQAGALDDAPIWSDVRTFDARPYRGVVDCITGGYPCQPFSHAGKRRGEDDPRHLWPHIRRIIEEVRPEWCFFENVEGHLSLGFDVVGRELSEIGYSVKAGLFSAAEIGSSHQRKRLFILAHSNSNGRAEGRQSRRPDRLESEEQKESGGGNQPSQTAEHSREDMENSSSARPQGRQAETGRTGRPATHADGPSPPPMADSMRVRHDRQEGNASEPSGDQSKVRLLDGGDNAVADSGSVERSRSDRPERSIEPRCRCEGSPERGGPPSVFPPGPGGEWGGICADFWPALSVERSVCGVADGLTNRVDRLRALGNAVLPLVAGHAWLTLFDEINRG